MLFTKTKTYHHCNLLSNFTLNSRFYKPRDPLFLSMTWICGAVHVSAAILTAWIRVVTWSPACDPSCEIPCHEGSYQTCWHILQPNTHMWWNIGANISDGRGILQSSLHLTVLLHYLVGFSISQENITNYNQTWNLILRCTLVTRTLMGPQPGRARNVVRGVFAPLRDY